MLKSVAFLKFVVALLHGIATAFQPVTENNHVLVGHVFQQLYARDWFNCIQACHDEPRCISYNYERSAGANGLCELNDCGVEDLCGRDKSLIYTKGVVFQQIREGKVSFMDNNLIIILPSGYSVVSVFVTDVLLVALSDGRVYYNMCPLSSSRDAGESPALAIRGYTLCILQAHAVGYFSSKTAQ